MDLHKWQRDSPEWRREEEQETLQGCSGRGAQFQHCKSEGSTGSQGARWAGASPAFCNCRVAQIFALSYLLPHLQPVPGLCIQSGSFYYSRFPLLKVTPDATCGRRWELLGTVASWHTGQHSEELRHKADKVRHGCERCWEWKCPLEFVQILP